MHYGSRYHCYADIYRFHGLLQFHLNVLDVLAVGRKKGVQAKFRKTLSIHFEFMVDTSG